MLIYYCPDCSLITRVPNPKGITGDHYIDKACSQCHVIRQAKIAEINSRYQSAEELGLLGSDSPLSTLCSRPTSSGKRIFHKTI